jgi:hypothetical protein
MAIAFDAAVEAFSAVNQTTLESGSMTIAGTNRILIVGVISAAGTVSAPSAVKWGGSGGASLTQIGTTIALGGFAMVSMWRLVNPNTGASTVHVTWAGAQDEKGLVGASYTGVDQGTPLGTPNQAGPTIDQNATVDIAGAVNDLIVDIVGVMDLAGGAPTLAAAGGQTSRNEVEGADLSYPAIGISDKAGAASVTMAWTIGAATIAEADDGWGEIGVALKPAGAGPSLEIPIVMHHRKQMGVS